MSVKNYYLAITAFGLLALACSRQTVPPAANDVNGANVNNNSVAPIAVQATPALPVNSNSTLPPTIAVVTPQANNNLAPPLSNSPNNPASDATKTGQPIPAREPEQYRATLTLRFDGATRPALTADIARNGTDRRWDFALPDGTRLTYLYQTDRLYIILPDKKIYAEQEGPAGAFTLPATLDPERLTQQLRADNRYQHAGATQFKQRAADKFQYLGGAESFVLLDKETGLPLRLELAQPDAHKAAKFTVTAIELFPSNVPLPLKHFNEPRDFQPVTITQIADTFRRITQAAAGH